MKTLFIIVTALLLSHYPSSTINQNRLLSSKETVYICNSTSATKYHSKEDCRGLNNCKTEIKSMDVKEAIQLGREECGWCY